MEIRPRERYGSGSYGGVGVVGIRLGVWYPLAVLGKAYMLSCMARISRPIYRGVVIAYLADN